MDLTISFEKIVSNFTRYHQYTLGSELRKKSREIVGLIIKANSTVEKLRGSKTGTGNFSQSRKVACPLAFGVRAFWLVRACGCEDRSRNRVFRGQRLLAKACRWVHQISWPLSGAFPSMRIKTSPSGRRISLLS